MISLFSAAPKPRVKPRNAAWGEVSRKDFPPKEILHKDFIP